MLFFKFFFFNKKPVRKKIIIIPTSMKSTKYIEIHYITKNVNNTVGEKPLK